MKKLTTRRDDNQKQIKRSEKTTDPQAEFLQSITSQAFTKRTLDLWNGCMRNPSGIRQFKNTQLYPIHKKGDTRDCTNHRGIATLNAEAKLAEQAILPRLNDFLDKVDYISETQFGFTQGLSTVDALLISRAIAGTAVENSIPLYKCYIDL